MIFIKTDSNNIVNYQHHMPFDSVYGMGKTEEELLAEGYLVESIPESTDRSKNPILKYNNGVVEIAGYEAIQVEKTPEEILRTEIEMLKTENANITYALMMGGLI